ncbi:phosphate ABC transporter permease subunit PstC [Liquorilactobacillus satsumensis]|uniref:Phosphate transport system permease protein n=1 Tax=Liquorilactobacillus satsumensis DSM 16230 = JCM 12392 TaxID=1423801 RepID=A0A0R1V855_9LACO|nr:phosphate ABC transporter permease subunit PstC [Liquorilactobacillus satsumensis]KRL98091.1 phosphate ABC transporter permease [Liquorilactobacillus satsumensis DSM 16230 = JCM 12392]MCC7667345.1 phosphate ABC transporter permease subunit PstC [Liquorilactobacillus satsumensis]MCP9313776.1 phosphate ABC transporter permease subunit PstC [Liquorilactobacillus satsumensis]MCP9329456.1 phosphate ABC transporter permease subunit PstC [Liquorilactobacillus satsumensis]MCP9358215.1 phosphate ABC
MEDPIKSKIQSTSKETRQDILGRCLTYLCIGLIVAIVLSIFIFVASKGIATFTVNKASLWEFLTGKNWNPTVTDASGKPQLGALPMITGSFGVTILAVIFATPFAIGTALYMTEVSSKKGEKILQSVIELLVGIPSVVYGFIGLSVIVPFVRTHFGGSGYGILSGSFVLFVMVLPTVTSMTVDSLRAVPRYYKEASLALGATRWQTIYKVLLRSATSGILTAIIFGMARAFGEALAVQMVIGNAAIMPKGLLSSASTLTSVLTMGIGNTVMGTVGNNALWSLALILLLMSLIFNIVVRLIGRKGRMD